MCEHLTSPGAKDHLPLPIRASGNITLAEFTKFIAEKNSGAPYPTDITKKQGLLVHYAG